MPQRRRQFDQVLAGGQGVSFIAVGFFRFNEQSPGGVIGPGTVALDDAFQEWFGFFGLAGLFVANGQGIHDLAVLRLHGMGFFQVR